MRNSFFSACWPEALAWRHVRLLLQNRLPLPTRRAAPTATSTSTTTASSRATSGIFIAPELTASGTSTKTAVFSRSEFENCWRGGGFYREAYYKPDYWTNYWTAFDANNDGYLSNDEYWSAAAWSRIDKNGNGRIDESEWVWWPM